MKHTFQLLGVLILTLFFTAYTSCVSDVDFDQTQDVVISPNAVTDLIFFNLDTSDFENVDTPEIELSVQDTTRLEFLNDDFIRENLIEITLDFQVDNSFGQSLVNRAAFINSAGVEQYVVEFEIVASPDGTLQRTLFTEVISLEDIQAISNSSQIANEVTLTTNGASINGELIFQSKATYALEFSDL
ncbi:hypothetical protein [Dokdonia sp.]|uniref:hypothetical protein n=1 Tax=Dokdonia sp. TaxID=2024995 RepID=UPI003267FBBE